MRTPVHHALPIRSPPTSFETQQSVTHVSVRPPGQQILVGEGDLVVDHAVDAQLPVVRVDRGNDQRRVDPVEVVVRHPPRRRCREMPVSAPAGTVPRVTGSLSARGRLDRLPPVAHDPAGARR